MDALETWLHIGKGQRLISKWINGSKNALLS